MPFTSLNNYINSFLNNLISSYDNQNLIVIDPWLLVTCRFSTHNFIHITIYTEVYGTIEIVEKTFDAWSYNKLHISFAHSVIHTRPIDVSIISTSLCLTLKIQNRIVIFSGCIISPLSFSLF